MSHQLALHASGDKLKVAAVPASLDFDWYPIVFSAGVAAGGSAHLTLRQDGSYTFRGHFHDSGAGAYKTALAWAVKDSGNQVYTFSHVGHISGTFEAGSRNDDWTVNGVNPLIASRWKHIVEGWTWRASANVNFDLGPLVQSVVQALGTVLGVAKIVGAV